MVLYMEPLGLKGSLDLVTEVIHKVTIVILA